MNKLLVISALSASMLVGCGGSGSSSESYGVTYSGVDTPAVIDTDSQDKLQTAAVEVILSSANSNEGLDSLPLGIETSSQGTVDTSAIKLSKDVVLQSIAALSNLPVAASETINGSCGGTMSVSGSETSATVTFKNFCDSDFGSDDLVFNGSAKSSTSGSTTTMTYTNFTVSGLGMEIGISGKIVFVEGVNSDETTVDALITVDGKSVEVSFTEVCSNTTYECTETIRLEGSNGIAYKVEDLEVNTYLDTVDVTGKVYEPEVGYVLLDATSVEFCVADDNSAQLSAGTIVMEDEDGNQLEITVTACGEYDVNIIENNVFEAQ